VRELQNVVPKKVVKTREGALTTFYLERPRRTPQKVPPTTEPNPIYIMRRSKKGFLVVSRGGQKVPRVRERSARRKHTLIIRSFDGRKVFLSRARKNQENQKGKEEGGGAEKGR